MNNPVVSTAMPGQDTRAPETPLEFTAENTIFKAMLEAHKAGEEQKCIKRRAVRRHRVNVEEEREKKKLLADETIIPDRTIEQNIANEKPAYIQFIEQPQTVISFFDPAQPQTDFRPYEDWFTDLCRYQNWKAPWLKLIDSLLLHGCGFMEVVPSDKPPYFIVEYVRRENLIMPEKTRDLTNCQRIARRYQLTKLKFKSFAASYEFNPAIADRINTHFRDKEEFIEIYKEFIRADDGSILIAWFADPTIGADDYLRAPQPYSNGEMEMATAMTPAGPMPVPRPKSATSFTIFAFPYTLEEDETLLETQGRAALDIHVQDGLTAAYSSTVNGSVRASRFYPTRKPAQAGDPPRDNELFVLNHGAVYEGEFSVFQPAWPNQILLTLAQALGVRNASQLGQVDFAAMSRNDTAKRATEITAAQQQADLLKSTKISLFSQKSLELYLICWRIVQSRLMVSLQQAAQFNTTPNNGDPIMPPLDPSPLFSPTLTLTMSADAQVVRRAERVAKYLQFYPVVQGTKFQDAYFQTMLKFLFPEEYPMWQEQVGVQTTQEQALGQALQMMQSVSPDSVPEQVRPAYEQTMDFIGQLITPAQPNGQGQ